MCPDSEHELTPGAFERIRAHSHLLGGAPAWIVARDLGVSVQDLAAFESRYARPNPLRPLTNGIRRAAGPVRRG